MPIPSPDAVLIDWADRIAAIPQRRGTPLPLVLMPLPFVEPLGIAMMGSLLLALSDGGPPTVLGLVFMARAAGDAVFATIRGRKRIADASAWTPATAMRYRADALEARETIAFFRAMKAVAGLASLVVLAGTFLSGGPPLVTVIVIAFATCCVGRMVDAYGDCVMPVDPDLRRRVAVPAGA